MAGPGDDVQLEVVLLAGGQQGIAEVVGALHIHVGVRLADGEEEAAAEVGGVRGAGVGRVPRADRVAHPLLVPPELVDAVVVAAAIGGAGAVEVAMTQQGVRGVLPAGRATEDAHPAQVHGGFDLRELAQPADAVRKTGVAQVPPSLLVELLAAIPRAASVDLHDVETIERRLPVVVVPEAEGTRHERVLRPRVDMLEHRILLLRVERVGPVHDAPDVELAVAVLGAEADGFLPAGRLELVQAAGQQSRQGAAVRAGAQREGRGEVDAGGGVDEVLAPR